MCYVLYTSSTLKEPHIHLSTVPVNLITTFTAGLAAEHEERPGKEESVLGGWYSISHLICSFNVAPHWKQHWKNDTSSLSYLVLLISWFSYYTLLKVHSSQSNLLFPEKLKVVKEKIGKETFSSSYSSYLSFSSFPLPFLPFILSSLSLPCHQDSFLSLFPISFFVSLLSFNKYLFNTYYFRLRGLIRHNSTLRLRSHASR
jgi:hypothetical protein